MPHPSDAPSPDDLSASEIERITHLVTRYLEQANTGSIPVLPSADPDAMLQRWNLPIPTAGKGIGDAYKLLSATLAESIHLHHPHYVGHQLSAPLPLAESVMIAWPQMVGLIAGTIVLFVAGYVLFQRQEVRA